MNKYTYMYIIYTYIKKRVYRLQKHKKMHRRKVGRQKGEVGKNIQWETGKEKTYMGVPHEFLSKRFTKFYNSLSLSL